MAEVDAQPAPRSTTFGIQPVSGIRTPFGIHEQGITKEMDEFSFRKILLNIDRNLMEKDILALKYLCLDKNIGLSHGDLEKVNRGLDLLEKLENKRLLSKSKLEVLFQLLGLIERYDLQREVEKCLDVQQKLRGIQSKKISSYRAMILDFDLSIEKKELESLKPILKPHIPTRTIERLNEPIELMIELEMRSIISPQSVTFLFQVADYLQNEDLVHKIEEFKGNYISHVAESLGDEWHMLGFALGLSSKDVDGVYDAQGMLQKFQEKTTEEDQLEKLCSGLRSQYVGRDDIANLLQKDIYIQPKSHGDSEAMSPVNVTTVDAIQCDTESLSPATDVSEGSVHSNNHRDTEPQVATIVSTQTESQGNTELVTPVSIREKCWCIGKWTLFIGGCVGILLSIILGVMSVLLKNDLGKNISVITGEIATTVTIIGFIMLIWDKCKASNCCQRNRKETHSQPRQFTGEYTRVGSRVELKINIPQ